MKLIIDHFFQIAYFLAYRMIKMYWGLRKPKTFGALITIWWQGEILLVKNSYLKYFSLPGGYLRKGEKPVEAAIRELQEEVGVQVIADDLTLVFQAEHFWENRRDNVSIFILETSEKPQITVDNREVLSAKFYPPVQALALDLFPPIVTCIEKYQQRKQVS